MSYYSSPNSLQVQFIPSCGHLPHVERPKQFVSIVNEFLGNL
jgi:pimeloyl-ACP methyl ester carboxylesterase